MIEMRTVRIMTHSDDTVDIEGIVTGDGIDTCAAEGVWVTVEIRDAATRSGVTVEAHYCTEIGARGDGVWAAVVRRCCEGWKLLPVRIAGDTRDGAYNIIVEIDAPVGSPVEYFSTRNGLRGDRVYITTVK